VKISQGTQLCSPHFGLAKYREIPHHNGYAQLDILWRHSHGFRPILEREKPLSTIEAAKKLAAFRAVDQHVLPEHRVSRNFLHFQLKRHRMNYNPQVIGIGSGARTIKIFVSSHSSTCSLFFFSSVIPVCWSSPVGSIVPYVVQRIVQQGNDANKNRVFIPTGSFCSRIDVFFV
jgi:hypothetical protein